MFHWLSAAMQGPQNLFCLWPQMSGAGHRHPQCSQCAPRVQRSQLCMSPFIHSFIHGCVFDRPCNSQSESLFQLHQRLLHNRWQHYRDFWAKSYGAFHLFRIRVNHVPSANQKSKLEVSIAVSTSSHITAHYICITTYVQVDIPEYFWYDFFNHFLMAQKPWQVANKWRNAPCSTQC